MLFEYQVCQEHHLKKGARTCELGCSSFEEDFGQQNQAAKYNHVRHSAAGQEWNEEVIAGKENSSFDCRIKCSATTVTITS